MQTGDNDHYPQSKARMYIDDADNPTICILNIWLIAMLHLDSHATLADVGLRPPVSSGVSMRSYKGERGNFDSLFDTDGLDGNEASRVRRLEATKLVH